MAFKVTSNSFRDGDYLGADHILSADFGFGCAGGNKSPQLAWSGAPAGTKSFAVTCFDPDAPTGSGFWHWLVVNIPANVTELALDAGNPKSPQAAGRRPADPHRLRRAGLRRPLPAARRPPPPLSLHGVRRQRRQPARQGRHLRGHRRLPAQLQYARQGGDHGPLQALRAHGARRAVYHHPVRGPRRRRAHHAQPARARQRAEPGDADRDRPGPGRGRGRRGGAGDRRARRRRGVLLGLRPQGADGAPPERRRRNGARSCARTSTRSCASGIARSRPSPPCAGPASPAPASWRSPATSPSPRRTPSSASRS